ncbi:MAG: hypothetical protein ACOCV4_01010 [Myxococcota bacterium]
MAKNVKTVLIPIVVVLVAAGIAYAAGRWQGGQKVKAVEAELTETRKQLESDLTETRSQLTECKQGESRLEARRRIHMAIEELDALNFGHAQEHLDEAGNVLAGAATGDAELGELAKELKAIDIEPSGQLDQQRNHIRRLADQFDQAVPPAQK